MLVTRTSITGCSNSDHVHGEVGLGRCEDRCFESGKKRQLCHEIGQKKAAVYSLGGLAAGYFFNQQITDLSKLSRQLIHLALSKWSKVFL
jgi:hypothetical protein